MTDNKVGSNYAMSYATAVYDYVFPELWMIAANASGFHRKQVRTETPPTAEQRKQWERAQELARMIDVEYEAGNPYLWADVCVDELKPTVEITYTETVDEWKKRWEAERENIQFNGMV